MSPFKWPVVFHSFQLVWVPVTTMKVKLFGTQVALGSEREDSFAVNQ